MVFTFLLFRVIAGDIAAAHLGPKATLQQKKDWAHQHGYDKPLFINTGLEKHKHTVPPGEPWEIRIEAGAPENVSIGGAPAHTVAGVTLVRTEGKRIIYQVAPGEYEFTVRTGQPWYDSQFVKYIVTTATFATRSIITNEKLYSIIVERAPYSLALTVPIMAIGWAAAMFIATIVAYYRGGLLDRVGVFLSVLGMCIPYLAFIIGIQYLMFQIKPTMAYGLANPFNVFVPVGIGVLAGLGGNVRFYRTVVLDETRRDYVRTALAKGLPLRVVMFKHILKNCMLPILTNLILTVPFLIMGSLLLESFFGIPGLGDLLLSSINNRDEPIVSGLTFLTALLYVVANLATDISYVIFDPRVKLS